MESRPPEKKAVQDTKRDRSRVLDLGNLLKQLNSDTYWEKQKFGSPNQSLNALRIGVPLRQRIPISHASLPAADEFCTM
jgi:hypothetical protein